MLKMAFEKSNRDGDSFFTIILPYLSLATFFLAWQLLVDYDVIPRQLLATPIDVIKLFARKLADESPDGALLITHTWISVQEAFLGYILALAIGIPFGLMMGWFRIFRGLTRPIFEMVRPIPPVALIPLAIFWFGIGLTSKVFIIWISGVIPCVINSYVGVKMTNPTLINMARTYGASSWGIFFKICVPSSLPMVFGALQIALAYSWISLVAAELVAANAGLGFLITMGRRLVMPDMVLLGMAMVALTGAILGLMISKLERRLLAGIRR
jgi:ABC-type nitrate/sulfonate/bicarbonate transport system permease component